MADDKNVERKDEPCSDSEEDEAAKILRQKRERGVLSGAGKPGFFFINQLVFSFHIIYIIE